MKKIKGYLLLAGILFCLLGAVPVSAEESCVYDEAGLLTVEEKEDLADFAQRCEEKWNMNFLAVTTDDTEGKTAQTYADDFYDQHFPESTEEDGVLYLIDMEHREIYISTSGLAIRYLTDQRIAHILDDAYGYAAEEDYYGTFMSFLENTEYYLQQGIPSNQYNYDIETGEKDYAKPKYQITSMEFLIALAAGMAAAAGTILLVKAKYQLKFEDFHYDAYTDSEIRLAVKEDRLINTIVTHRRIPKNDSGSGGRSSGGSGRSSVHHSSSGRSHGGGGRKF